ncbi:MAG: signal recognition particle-docking protein FtsY [Candidatus Aenigmarchaeota archaeon]|nr:signal recognition particle-docking protein FtsY [Candidatus Aenigmarchaeota archaeon]
MKEAISKVSKSIKEEKPEEEQKESKGEMRLEGEKPQVSAPLKHVLQQVDEKELEKMKEELPEDLKPEALEITDELKEEAEKEPEEVLEELRAKEITEEKKEELKPEIKIEEEKEELESKRKMRIEGEKKQTETPKGVSGSSVSAPIIPEKKGFFSRIFKRVKEKTLSEDDIEKILKELKLALLENDTALETAERICSDVKSSLLNKAVKRGDVDKVIKESLSYAMLDVMSQEKPDLEKIISSKKEPFVIVFFGFNGTGKTTTIAKFANKFKQFKPILAAGDTFRAASIEQLEEHGRRLGAEVIKQGYGSDSAAVIFDAIKHASAVSSKLVLADTAGRSHSNVNLMDELKKVVRVNKPDLKVLVLDSITGNDIYEQSRLFNDAVGVDAMILTKADVYEKGGAALSASYTIKKPILFLGTGQEYGDLKEFNPEEIVKNLLE